LQYALFQHSETRMPRLNNPTLDTFARLIARGHAPIEAAMQAGCMNLRRSGGDARLARPQTERPQNERPETERPKIARPTLEPELTDEEWLAEYAPRLRGETGVRP
jgi:hypothetical protein